MLNRFVHKVCFAFSVLGLICGVGAGTAQAQDNEDLTRLDTDNPEAFAFFNAIGIYDFLRIVADESVMGAEQIRSDLFPGVAPEVWESEMRTLFAPEEITVAFEEAWNDDTVGPDVRARITEFYTSELGRRIVASEIAARAGMADPGIAEAARSAVAMAARDSDARLERFSSFSAELGLVDRNVSSMMNAQVQFLSGLSDGGGLRPPMPEQDMLRFVAGQMAEMTSEAEDWLAAYHLMAYGAFSAEEFAQFAEVNLAPEGQALASAIFAAFDTAFDDLQYQMGLAAARYAAGDDI